MNRMKQTFAPARNSGTRPDTLNGLRPIKAQAGFEEAHARYQPGSRCTAAVCRSGAGGDLRVVCDRSFADLRYADGGQFRPRRILHGRRLCRAMHPDARWKLLDMLVRCAACDRAVWPFGRTVFDTAALWSRNRLSAASYLWAELRTSRGDTDRLRENWVSLRHPGYSAGRRRHWGRLFSSLPSLRDRCDRVYPACLMAIP